MERKENKTEERKREMLKAAVSGMPAAEIAALENLLVAQVKQAIVESAEEMAAIHKHL